VLLRKEREKKKLNIFYFFLVTRGVRASLRAPQLIPGPTEHCKPSRQVRHHGVDRRARWDSNPGDRGKAAGPQTSVQKKKKNQYHYTRKWFYIGHQGTLWNLILLLMPGLDNLPTHSGWDALENFRTLLFLFLGLTCKIYSSRRS